MFLGMVAPKMMVSYIFKEICRLVGRMVSMSQFLSQQAVIESFDFNSEITGHADRWTSQWRLWLRLNVSTSVTPLRIDFFKYRSISGGRFLVSLREVQSSEKILIRRSLLKSGIDFWKCDLGKPDDDEKKEVWWVHFWARVQRIRDYGMLPLWRFYRGLLLHRRVRCKKNFG